MPVRGKRKTLKSDSLHFAEEGPAPSRIIRTARASEPYCCPSPHCTITCLKFGGIAEKMTFWSVNFGAGNREAKSLVLSCFVSLECTLGRAFSGACRSRPTLYRAEYHTPVGRVFRS